MLAWQGRPEEAEPLIQHSERIVTPEIEPGAAIGVCFARAILELARGRDQDALAAARAVERLAARLATPDLVVPRARALQLLALTRLGDTEHAEQALAGLEEQERERGDLRVATAALRLAQDDPQAAAATLAPVLDGSASMFPWEWPAGAFLLEASAQDALGDQIAAGRALEHALDLAEPDGALLWFLVHPVPGLLERHTGHRTAHAALIAQVLSLLARPPASSGMASAPGRRGLGEWNPRLTEPLSSSEIRVLRYLPTNLTAPEIADELSVSRNTVKTHMRNLYAKLGTHRRAEAVTRARDLGLLATWACSRPRPAAPASACAEAWPRRRRTSRFPGHRAAGPAPRLDALPFCRRREDCRRIPLVRPDETEPSHTPARSTCSHPSPTPALTQVKYEIPRLRGHMRVIYAFPMTGADAGPCAYTGKPSPQ